MLGQAGSATKQETRFQAELEAWQEGFTTRSTLRRQSKDEDKQNTYIDQCRGRTPCRNFLLCTPCVAFAEPLQESAGRLKSKLCL